MSEANVEAADGQVRIAVDMGDGETVLMWLSPDRALLLAAALAQHAAAALLQDAAEACLTGKVERRLTLVKDP